MSGSGDPEPSLGGLEREVLEYIAKGLNINSWLIDALGNIDGHEFQRLVNGLEADGLIVQRGDIYLGKVTYDLTERGLEALPPLSEDDRAMLADYGLDADSLATLEAIGLIERRTVRLTDVADSTGLAFDYQKALIEKLAEDGYLAYRGMLVPKLVLTDRGEDVVRRYRFRAE